MGNSNSVPLATAAWGVGVGGRSRGRGGRVGGGGIKRVNVYIYKEPPAARSPPSPELTPPALL